MTKIDIISGFLGAGKTTLIKKLISEAYVGEKLVLIENEFGEIGIDGGFLKDAGIEINEMNSGCICCSLVGDFTKALSQVLDQYSPDRIIIEPSGVGKLSDVIRAVLNVGREDMVLNSFSTVADANKCKMYMKNFGEFYNDQVEHAGAIILSHTQNISQEKLSTCVSLLRELNPDSVIVSSPWDKLDGKIILDAMERSETLDSVLKELEHEHHHHQHHHDEDCDCGCHGEHHHHEHHHEHDEDCDCGCHGEHHHHHADEIFTSWGCETPLAYSADEISEALDMLQNEADYGMVLRAKGIVQAIDGRFIHFDYVPGEADVRYGSAAVIGRICVIGSALNTEAIEHLFRIK